MYLLNARKRELQYFVGSAVPRYAILSHTWAEDEVTFKDLTEPSIQDVKKKQGYAKIVHTCDQALLEGLEYAWVDTCCIDKSSSAELSEAINSMFRLYAEAAVCYAYLSDVSTDLSLPYGLHESYYHASLPDTYETDEFSSFPLVDSFFDLKDLLFAHCSGFIKSRWFLRGWTLQELIAPTRVMFFDDSWKLIGDRRMLSDVVQRITGVNHEAFGRPSYLERCSIAQRMSWAALRTTTREEDKAYSLLGIFGINMPMLYGEGSMAFIRLQEAIISRNSDQSIFAWNDSSEQENPATTKSIRLPDSSDETLVSSDTETIRTTILAPGTYAFRHCDNFRPRGPTRAVPFSITNAGLQVTLPLCRLGHLKIGMTTYATFGAILNCGAYGDWVGISLFKLEASSSIYYIHKKHGRRLQYFDAVTAQTAEVQSITIVEPWMSFQHHEPPQVVFRLEEVLSSEVHLTVDSSCLGQDWRPTHLSKEHDTIQIHRSHFTSNTHPSLSGAYDGAIILGFHEGTYPLKIGVHLYYELTSSFVSYLALQLHYWTPDWTWAACLCSQRSQGIVSLDGPWQVNCIHQLTQKPTTRSIESGPLNYGIGLSLDGDDYNTLYAEDRIRIYPSNVSLEPLENDAGIELQATLKMEKILDQQCILLDLKANAIRQKDAGELVGSGPSKPSWRSLLLSWMMRLLLP